MKKAALLIMTTVFLTLGVGGFCLGAGLGDIQPKLPPQFPPILQIKSVVLDKTSVVAGSIDSDIIGTVILNVKIPNTKQIVTLSVSPFNPEAGFLAFPESDQISVSGDTGEGQFKIKTKLNPSYAASTQCTVTATLGPSKRTAGFTVEQLKINSLVILPPGGFGPYTGTGTLTMSATPAPGTTVALTSSPSNVITFGPAGTSQSSTNVRFNGSSAIQTFPVVAGSVSQTTPVTIKASFNRQEVSTVVTIR